MQINPVMTLNKRREALKRLAKNPETTVKEFHALLGDATEDERAVLAKTLLQPRFRAGEPGCFESCRRLSFSSFGGKPPQDT